MSLKKLCIGVLFFALASFSYASEMRMHGYEPAYQVGRYNSHNRFCYGGGKCILKGQGKIDIAVDPEKGTGKIVATFDGPDGKWKIVAKKFKMVKTDVALHGATGGDVKDSKMSPPLIPQVWTYLATWGPAVVFHNG